MTAVYISIIIGLVLFILVKSRYKKPLPEKYVISPERQAYLDAVALKLKEPPEIVYGVDPLRNERIQRMHIGIFQTAMIQQKLLVPDDIDDFFYFKEMNGYQIGVTVKWAIKFLNFRIENSKFESNTNGDKIIIENLNKGLRKLDYELLETAGNSKYNEKYKKANNLPVKEKLFSIHFILPWEIKKLLRNESIVVKNIATGEFENYVSYCETKEHLGPFAGGDYFQLFIADTLIYKVQTLFY